MRKYFNISKKITNFVCIFATLCLIGMWIFIYNLDNDSTVIERKEYFETDKDGFPVMSLCFNQFFDDRYFTKFGNNITAKSYKNFLLGNHYDEILRKINYQEVTSNLSDFIIKYDVQYRNATEIFTQENVAWKPVYYTFSWESWGTLLKCFGFEITNKDLYHVRIMINREIFKDNVMDEAGGFAVLFHYPNQTLSSLQTVKRQWVVWDNKTNHFLSFNIKNMETNALRYKEDKNNCVVNWKNYDDITLNNHIKMIGCRTPDQFLTDAFPVCSTKQLMKQARIPLNNNKLRPCRRVESVDYELGETKSSYYYGMKESTKWFSIVVRVLNPRFKETVQRKEVDIQTLLGYIGGYTGIITGFAIIQIPEFLMNAFRYLRSFYS